MSVDAAAAQVDGAGTEGTDRSGSCRFPMDVAAPSWRSIRRPAVWPRSSIRALPPPAWATKEEVQRRLLFSDYREVGDLLLPFDVATFEDGSTTAHMRYESIMVLDAFDPAWVRVPDPTRRFIPSEELAF